MGIHVFGWAAVIAFFLATSIDAAGPFVLVSGLLAAVYLLAMSDARRTHQGP